ncbi:hypothetical protein ABMA27_005220 [Loxostege sticticalis]|uniref:Uncharacterized protein n=1 Tax=Loxostege sticticalis TaxID=481309 RepID=A0ABR3HM77_LOXSC
MEAPVKKQRGLWTLQQLEAAMRAVQGGTLSQRAAAARYSIPRRTLSNHLKSGKVEKQIGRRTILTKEQENDLASRIRRLSAVGFPLTPKVIRHQAYVFCEQHGIPNNFNEKAKKAGKDWLKLFLKRHSDISKRKVQILNPGRAQKLNKPIVIQHFEEYKKIYEELDIGNQPQRLYNMDEKGCRLTIHNQPVVLAQKGAKRVHMIAPEHAENVTIAACVNALGSPIPPMIIFKGKRLKPEFKDNLPAGALVKMANKGSMTTSLFVEFIKHLGKYKTSGKCLLIFDGASCHLDYNIVDAADKEDIVLYCLPSNTTHELQPLDKSVNKAFEHYWDEETMLFFYQNPDKKITKARFNSIFSRVWSKCMSHENIVNGFRATGLYPFNPDAIPPEAFAPSVLTERAVQQSSTAENDRSLQKSPPIPIGITRQAVQSPSSDSDKTFLDDENTRSPSLLQTQDFVQSASSTRLVDYSSTSSENDDNFGFITNTSDTVTRRPIIYSSASDSSFSEELIPRRKLQPQFFNDIYEYSSSENENTEPVPRQQCTPTKQIIISNDNVGIPKDASSTSDDPEDNIPLARLKAKTDTKTPFQQLLPTPNFAVVKQKPRRKAINYKGQIVTKDLFAKRDSKKNTPMEQKKQKKSNNNQQQNKETSVKRNPEKKNQEKKQTIEQRQRYCHLTTEDQHQSKKTKENSKKDRELKYKHKKQTIQTKTNKKLITKGKKEGKSEHNDDKWYCFACNEERFEDMRQCTACKKWFHELCLGLTKEDVDFECPMCN